MDLLVNWYRAGWAFRYLREAKADLMSAERASSSSTSVSLSVLSMKKSQAALYFCLGDPIYLDSMVKFAIKTGGMERRGIMGFLVLIEKIIQRINDQADVYDRIMAIKEARFVNNAAQEVVELITGRGYKEEYGL